MNAQKQSASAASVRDGSDEAGGLLRGAGAPIGGLAGAEDRPRLTTVLAFAAVGAIAISVSGGQAFAGEAPAATVIDFDDMTHPTVWSGARYAHLGATFSSTTDELYAEGDPVNSHSKNIHVYDRAFRDFTISFARPVSSLSFWVIDGEYTPLEAWTVRLFDMDGGLLRTLVGRGGFAERPFEVSFEREAFDIGSMTFTPSSEREGLDTFSFVMEPAGAGQVIPLPSAAGMALAGVWAVGGRRQRRH